MPSLARRVMVIGLDGVPFDLIEGWVTEGRLPTLARFFQKGAVGPLTSTMPPTSAPSWTSFATGMNPGKTGVYDFLYREPGSYRFFPTNAARRSGASLWKLLSEAGRRVGVVNVPMSYPVEPVNGYMISGWMTPYMERNFTFPSTLRDELLETLGKYCIYPTETFAEQRRAAYLAASYKLLDQRTRTALYLLETRGWDFFMMVFFDTDRLLHQLWHDLDPCHPWHRNKNCAQDVRDYFEELDRCLAKILSYADEETLVIVLSDHGMGAAHEFVVMNNWLLDQGFLRFKKDPITAVKHRLFKMGFTLRNVHRAVDALGLAKFAEYASLYSTDHILKLAFLSFRNVDWSHSRAYSFGRHYAPIYVNLVGREPQGIVQPGREYEQLLDEIGEAAWDYRHPQTGEPLFGDVIRGSQIYNGSHSSDAPDLIVLPAKVTTIFFGLADFGSREIVSPVYRYSGMHRPEGLLLMRGPSIRPGYRLTGTRIVDLAPTILHALGVPVPDSMDGNVIESAYVEEALNSFPVKTVQGSPVHPQDGREYNKDEAQVIERRLRNLGYLE